MVKKNEAGITNSKEMWNLELNIWLDDQTKFKLITYHTELRLNSRFGTNPESTESCVPTMKQLEVPLQKGWEEGVKTKGNTTSP